MRANRFRMGGFHTQLSYQLVAVDVTFFLMYLWLEA
jgi:hypothetical protein